MLLRLAEELPVGAADSVAVGDGVTAALCVLLAVAPLEPDVEALGVLDGVCTVTSAKANRRNEKGGRASVRTATQPKHSRSASTRPCRTSLQSHRCQPNTSPSPRERGDCQSQRTTLLVEVTEDEALNDGEALTEALGETELLAVCNAVRAR